MLYIGIPAYNEATTIGVLLWRLRSVLADVSREYEVVVYDDASTDGTAKTLEPYTRVLPLTLLSGSRRVGYAGAIDALVRHVARTTRYPRRDALLLLQGDFTDPPALVPEFLRRFEGGADLIIGERATVGDAPTAVRRLWSASRWVLRPFVGVTDVRDLTSSYRLVRIAVLRDLLKSVGDAPVATGDVWAANADFLLRTAALSRRVETIPVTPTFGVRTRETRRAAWPDTMALAKWGWGRRGQRVVVKVIARTVEVPAEVDEAPIEAPERVAVPERSERPDRGARGERRPRRESSERVPERPRRSRERPAPRATEAAPELVAGAAESAESESVESPSREARTRRKRGRRDRTRKESGLAATSGESEPMTEPSSGTAAEGAEREGAEREGAEREGPSASEGAEPLDMSEEGVARRRKRTRRGRRRKSGAASEGSAEDGAASTQSNDESSDGPSDGPSNGPRDESRDSSEARRSGERAPRAESPYADEQEPSAPRERSADESETGSEDGDGAKRRRSRRGRRGGGRRRAEGNEEGSGEASSEGPSAGGSEAGGESRRIGPEGAERSEP